MARRIGLFGGTFDPPHKGHVAAATAVRDALGLDEVRLVVANDPWQKSGERQITPAGIRLEMTRALAGEIPGLIVDDSEIVRGGPTYTVDTLEELRIREPDVQAYVIVGSDTARRIGSWNRFADVVRLSTLVVVNRPTDAVAVPDGVPAERCEFVTMVPMTVSSTQVRERASLGSSVADLTGEAVAALIERHGLYRSAR